MDKNAIERFLEGQVAENICNVKSRILSGSNFFKYKLKFDRMAARHVLLGLDPKTEDRKGDAKGNEHFGEENLDDIVSLMFCSVKRNFEASLKGAGHNFSICDSGRHASNGPEYRIKVNNEDLDNEIRETKDLIKSYNCIFAF